MGISESDDEDEDGNGELSQSNLKYMVDVENNKSELGKGLVD